MNSNKQLFTCTSVKSIELKSTNTQPSCKQIIDRLFMRKKYLQTEISATKEKANYFQSIQQKVEQLKLIKEQYSSNLSEINQIQQKLVHRKATQKKYKEQLMAAVISTEVIQLQLKHLTHKLINEFNYKFGYECQNPSPKYCTLSLIQLETKIENPDLGIRKNIVEMGREEIERNGWQRGPIEWIIEKKMANKLYRRMLKKINREEEKKDYETWMKYIKLLKDLENHSERDIDIDDLVAQSVKIKHSFEEEKEKTKELKKKIKIIENDIRKKEDTVEDIRTVNTSLCGKIKSLNSYEQEYHENNPQNTISTYLKELKQVEEAIKYFETKLQYDQPPLKIKEMKTVETSEETNVLRSEIFYSSPYKRMKKNSSLRRIWR